jgi:quercetin dioxygenase-like cupin family protein
MYVSSLEQVKKTKPNMEGAKGVYKQIPISKENGTPTFSFRVFTIEPGGHTPLHSHPFEHLNYVIEGNGAVVAEDQEHELKKGDFVLVLPGETHQYKNTSADKPLTLICAVPKEYE